MVKRSRKKNRLILLPSYMNSRMSGKIQIWNHQPGFEELHYMSRDACGHLFAERMKMDGWINLLPCCEHSWSSHNWEGKIDLMGFKLKRKSGFKGK